MSTHGAALPPPTEVGGFRAGDAVKKRQKVNIEFSEKYTSDVTDTDRRRIWTSRCGQYRIVENRSLFGLPTVWHAQVRVQESWGWCWDLLGRHRTRKAAERRIRQHLRQSKTRQRTRKATSTPKKG